LKSVSIYTVVFLGEAQEGDSVVKQWVKCKGQEISPEFDKFHVSNMG